jgi:3-methylfumaryl-CoA hydratase
MAGTTREEADRLLRWVGRSETASGYAYGALADVLSATLDRDDPPHAEGAAFPPGWHWLCFPEAVKLEDTGHDGHPRTGGFMPPVQLPRRMWAGNRMEFLKPIRAGDRLERRSTIADVRLKSGSGGKLCFVTVRHEIHGANGLATVEEHDVVYREAIAPGAPAAKRRPAPAEPLWSRTVSPTPVLLFRFSALTMNSHRIHYDRTFAVDEEGYPGLVFHGPLTMILLMDLFRRASPRARLDTFAVRATAPLYDDRQFEIQGAPGESPGEARLWALSPDGGLAMLGEATYAETDPQK